MGHTLSTRHAPTILIALLACASVQAQDPPAVEKEREALQKLKTVYETAVNENRIELLEPHLHSRFSGVMITNEVTRSMQELRDYWVFIQDMIGEGGSYEVAVTNEPSRIFDGKLALSTGTTEDEVVTAAGKEYRFTTNWTAVCEKVAGEWKILRMQVSMDPIGNPFVVAAISAAGIWSGVLGGALGIVVGAILGLFIRRRPRAA